MNAIEFVKKFGIDRVKLDLSIVDNHGYNSLFTEDFSNQLKQIVDAFDLVGDLGGLERVKNAINGKHIGYTHFYLHSNNRYVFLDHYVDFIPDHVQHIGMFNKVIELVEKCNES